MYVNRIVCGRDSKIIPVVLRALEVLYPSGFSVFPVKIFYFMFFFFFLNVSGLYIRKEMGP